MLPSLSNSTWHSGAASQPMPPTALLETIKDAIAHQDESAVRQQLGKANLSPEALQDLLAHAFLQKSSHAIKVALLHSGCTPHAALELAVQHKDISIVRQALQLGADPQKITVYPGDDGIHTLLIYARRKNKLYPSNASHGSETDFDRILQNGLDDSAKAEAEKLLNDVIDDKDLQEVWRDAVKYKQLDIQRAILLLKADKDRGFRLKQEDAVTDKGVAEVMKEIPYFSPKRKLPENFNDKVSLPGDKGKIACRHLVMHRHEVQEQHPQIKFDDSQYASVEAIIEHVSYDTQAKYNHLRARAMEARLFHNCDFGKTLVQQFRAMATEGAQTRLILLLSANHAMGVGLKIKEKDGETHYVTELFDPNFTTSHVRIASDNLHTFEVLTLGNLIADEDAYKAYYPKSENLSMMFVRSSTEEEQTVTGSVRGAVENRILTSGIKDSEINAVALFHMMRNGFAGDLRRLKHEIASRPEMEQTQLLTAKDASGNPGFGMALQNGHADVIKVFGELWERVSTEEVIELLMAKNTKGVPGLYLALENGHADAIKAFGELLERVPPEKLVELLVAKDADGVPGLYVALQNGHANAIKAFGELLERVPSEKLAKLLAAKIPRGFPGFYVAMQNGHADAMKAFGELLTRVPSAKVRAELLAAYTARNTPGLFIALRNGHADAIRVYGELLELAPPEMLAELLAAKNANGVSGYAEALRMRKLDAMEQYVEIVKKTAPLLRDQELNALLESIRESMQEYG